MNEQNSFKQGVDAGWDAGHTIVNVYGVLEGTTRITREINLHENTLEVLSNREDRRYCVGYAKGLKLVANAL
jgi:hypothetical protein